VNDSVCGHKSLEWIIWETGRLHSGWSVERASATHSWWDPERWKEGKDLL